MNWIFEAYSNVYNTASLQKQGFTGNIATANNKPAAGFLNMFTRK